MTFRIKLVTTLVAGLLFAACGTEGTGLFISDSQEEEIGLGVHEEVILEYPIINDPVVQAWVDDIGTRLAVASVDERDGVNYQFFVVDADIVNAFAAPGGFIYFTKELVLAADNEAEVA